MATIRYTFADGHTEEVEVTEEFKREYEFLLVREQAPHWKEMKQKERAGLRCVKNLSLDKFSEDGYDLPVAGPDPLERLIQKEERREYCRKILSCLSEKQRQAYSEQNLNIEQLISAEVKRLSEKYGKSYLDCEELIELTGLGRDNVRALMSSANFPITKVGNRKVVSILAFVTWQMRGFEQGGHYAA